MNYFISKVGSIVTGGGTEIRTLEMPNILKARLACNAGVALLDVRPIVIHSERLFYNAINISGWCHARGNLMKYLAEGAEHWDAMLRNMQTMIEFWRNKTARFYQEGCRGYRLRFEATRCFPSHDRPLALRDYTARRKRALATPRAGSTHKEGAFLRRS